MNRLRKYKGVIGRVIMIHDHGCDMQFALDASGKLQNFNPESFAQVTFYVPKEEIK